MIIDDKLMKYVIFKKRTIQEMRTKCKKLDYTEEYTNEIIDYLKEANYLNDEVYVQKYILEIMKLKRASVNEIKIDLIKRGVDENIIEKYIDEDVQEFETNSAIYLASKKYKAELNIEKVKKYLYGKGYTYSNIAKAIDNIEILEDNE